MKPTRDESKELARKAGFGEFFIKHNSFRLKQLATLAFAAGQASKSEWQPIATAPKDGTVFLGYRDGKMRESYRVQRPDCEMWVFGSSSGAVEIAPQLKPTHWMPLPAAPSQETGGLLPQNAEKLKPG